MLALSFWANRPKSEAGASLCSGGLDGGVGRGYAGSAVAKSAARISLLKTTRRTGAFRRALFYCLRFSLMVGAQWLLGASLPCGR